MWKKAFTYEFFFALTRKGIKIYEKKNFGNKCTTKCRTNPREHCFVLHREKHFYNQHKRIKTKDDNKNNNKVHINFFSLRVHTHTHTQSNTHLWLAKYTHNFVIPNRDHETTKCILEPMFFGCLLLRLGVCVSLARRDFAHKMSLAYKTANNVKPALGINGIFFFSFFDAF